VAQNPRYTWGVIYPPPPIAAYVLKNTIATLELRAVHTTHEQLTAW